MKKFMNFLKSPMGKFLLTAIVVGIIVYIAYKQYEKKFVFAGNSKKEVISDIASKYAKARIERIKNNDPNYDGTNLAGLLSWYDENMPSDIPEADLKVFLSGMGIDFVKYPASLNIKNDVDSIAILSNYQ